LTSANQLGQTKVIEEVIDTRTRGCD